MKINECVFKLQLCLFIINFTFQLQSMQQWREQHNLNGLQQQCTV